MVINNTENTSDITQNPLSPDNFSTDLDLSSSEPEIDLSQIKKPHIEITANAFAQLKVMKENDFLNQHKEFRLKISGKKCEGFLYDFGFSFTHENDFVLKITDDETIIPLHIDPFTAYYFQNGTIDYFFSPEEDEEGFVITNHDQEKFEGKFWRDNPDMVPEVL